MTDFSNNNCDFKLDLMCIRDRLHIPVLGPGSIGDGESKLVAFRNMSSLNMTIVVYAPVDHGLCTKG